MKIVLASLVSALMVLSMPTFAGSHGGGKVDCKDSKNKDHKDCQKKWSNPISKPCPLYSYQMLICSKSNPA